MLTTPTARNAMSAGMLCVALAVLSVSGIVGCGDGDDAEKRAATGQSTNGKKNAKPPRSEGASSNRGNVRDNNAGDVPVSNPVDKRPPRRPPSLADLMTQEGDQEPIVAPGDDQGEAPWQMAQLPRKKIDDAKMATAGIRKLTGKHVTIYTDLPSDREVDELPGVFDLAFPQWCKYFHVDQERHEKWHMIAYIIKDKPLFRRVGLLPADLPPFQNGYQRGAELWVYEKESPYYRRHLLVHEGTHGFMNNILGGTGPPWYTEGTAELLGTHQWKDGRLRLRYFPPNREAVPYWGRVKIIKEEYAAGRGKGMIDVLRYVPDLQR